MAKVTKYRVWLAWGAGPANAAEHNALEPEKYEMFEFETEAEMHAFLLGVEKADGWMQHKAVLEDPQYKYLRDPEYHEINEEAPSYS